MEDSCVVNRMEKTTHEVANFIFDQNMKSASEFFCDIKICILNKIGTL